MTERFHLSDATRRRLEERCQYTALAEPARDGYFRLFNKNAWRTAYVRPVAQVPHEMVWIVEAETPIDPYLVRVLVPA